MKKAFGILAAGVLAACGSSSSNNGGLTAPTPTSYTYGTGAPVSEGTEQATAATDANTNTQSIVSATQTGTVSSNASTLNQAPTLPETLTADLGTAQRLIPAPAYEVVGSISKATRSGQLDTGCYTVSGNTITYNNCNYDYGSGYTFTTSGTLTATPTSIVWNIKAEITFTDTSSGGLTYVIDGTWTGNLGFAVSSTDVVITGTATDAWSGNVTSSQENASFAYTAQIVFKSLDISQSCDVEFGGGADSGKLDISVTAIANQGSAAQYGYENYGYEFTWTGCDTILVAAGTAG
jgi:hypothetical protein